MRFEYIIQNIWYNVFCSCKKVENAQNSLILWEVPCTDNYECGFAPRIIGDYDGLIVFAQSESGDYDLSKTFSSVVIKNFLKTFSFNGT